MIANSIFFLENPVSKKEYEELVEKSLSYINEEYIGTWYVSEKNTGEYITISKIDDMIISININIKKIGKVKNIKAEYIDAYNGYKFTIKKMDYILKGINDDSKSIELSYGDKNYKFTYKK